MICLIETLPSENLTAIAKFYTEYLGFCPRVKTMQQQLKHELSSYDYDYIVRSILLFDLDEHELLEQIEQDLNISDTLLEHIKKRISFMVAINLEYELIVKNNNELH